MSTAKGEFDGWLLLDRRDLRRASELTHLCHPKMTQAGGSLGQGWWHPERPYTKVWRVADVTGSFPCPSLAL